MTRTRAFAAASLCALALIAGCASQPKASPSTPPSTSASANPQVSAQATESASAPEASSTTPSADPSAQPLPTGVWPGVRQPLPASTREVTTTTTLGGQSDAPIAVLHNSAGTVGCEFPDDAALVMCQLPKADFTCLAAGGPDRTHESCSLSIQGGKPDSTAIYSVTGMTGYGYALAASEPILALGIGETARRGDFACHNDTAGMTCWNLKTGHGALISPQRITPF